MSTLEFFSLIVAAAALFGWASRRWLKLPLTVGTMLLTVLASIGLLGLSHFYPHLNSWAAMLVGTINFENLILHGMLSVLLFAGAFLLDLESLLTEKLIVVLLSVGGTLLSSLLTAALLWWGLPLIGLHVPWIHCFIFGALISPTDPIVVLEMLRRVGVPKNIQAQLAGESLFNDGVAAVLFLALLQTASGTAPTPSHFLIQMVLAVGGGIALGVLLAWSTSMLMRWTDAYQVEILLTIALATGSYALADQWHLSAPLTAVVAGISLRRFNLAHPHTTISHESIDTFWEVIDEVQNAILFVLLGFEILAIPFSRLPLEAGAAAIATVTIVRLAVVALIVSLLRLLQPGHRSSIRILSWGGMRGGLSLALALSIPHGMGRTWILVATYSVVLFSIVVQGGSMDVILKRLLRHHPVE